jgi:hypothetical protein
MRSCGDPSGADTQPTGFAAPRYCSGCECPQCALICERRVAIPPPHRSIEQFTLLAPPAGTLSELLLAPAHAASPPAPAAGAVPSTHNQRLSQLEVWLK